MKKEWTAVMRQRLRSPEVENVSDSAAGSPGAPGRRIVPPASGDPFNEMEETIFRRRSVRAYREQQVPEHLVRRILEAGRFAPSAGNVMPWKLIVVRDPEMIAQMTADMVSVCRKLLKLDYTRPGQRGRAWLVRLLQSWMPNDLHPIPLAAMWQIAEERVAIWHGAPTVIIILVDERAPGKCMVDAGIVGQTIVLTAHSFGLGTCWVGFVELLNRLPAWRERLGIWRPFKIGGSIALGYPRGTPDGYVTRETVAVDWYEPGGERDVKY